MNHSSSPIRFWVMVGVVVCALFGLAALTIFVGAALLGPADTAEKPFVEYTLPDEYRAQAVGFTPDGKDVAVLTLKGGGSPAEEYRLVFWDAKTNAQVRSVALPPPVSRFAFFAGGRKLATTRKIALGFNVFGGENWEFESAVAAAPTDPPAGPGRASPDIWYDGSRLWDLETRKAILFPAERVRTDNGTRLPVSAVAASPSGAQYAVAFSAPRIDLYDTATAATAATLGADDGIFHSVLYSPDGRFVAAGHLSSRNESRVYIWDAVSHQLLHKCDGCGLYVPELAFTPDSKYVLTFTRKIDQNERISIGHVTVWAVETGKLVEKFNVGDCSGVRFALSPDGSTLVTVGDNGKVRKWDFAAIRKEFEAKK